MLVGLADAANARANVYSLWANGMGQGDGRRSSIRSPPNNSAAKDAGNPDIACNVNTVAGPNSASVNAGDKVVFGMPSEIYAQVTRVTVCV